MDSIIKSNHICFPYTCNISNNNKSTFWNQLSSLEREVYSINLKDGIGIQQKIRRKVVLALCGVDDEGLFDLSHFNDLPLQLMPRVLELVQKHSEARTQAVSNMPTQLEKDALSRLFHTLRGWELPLLFENLNKPSTNGGKRKRRKTRR